MKPKKAILPIAGLGTRFLPISKTIPKEFLPLNAKPVIQYVVENALEAGVKEFIFVISPQKRKIFERYVKEHFSEKKEDLIKILKEKGKEKEIMKLKQIPKIKWKVAIQRKPKGDGDAILKAEKFIKKKEPFLVLFGDDISFGKKSFAAQLTEAFEKYKKPILALYKLPKTKLSHYGVPRVEKLGNKIYRILDLIEKPKENPPSSFALVGNYLLTPEIFQYLKKTPPFHGEIILLNALKLMLKEKEILGLEVEGKWLECGDLKRWVKSFLFLAKKEKLE